MPTATDLVTDLPADFEVFGQAVATSMADLLGGTTGQVLAKASNTDMDFVWSADAAGMTNPMTTTGDTIYSSSGSTPARLGIGTTGQILTVAGGVPSWGAAPSAGGMTLLSTTTLSGATTTISSISGSYKSLYAYIHGVTISNLGADIWINPNSSSTITTQGGLQNDNGSATFAQPAGASTLRLNQGIPILNTGGVNAWALTINNYASATTVKTHDLYAGYRKNGGTDVSYMVAGYINTTSAITSLVFTVGSGTYNGGTVLLYGVN